MPSIRVRNFPDDLLEQIKQRAKEHGRSVNAEVLDMIARGIAMRKRQREEDARREERMKQIEARRAQERQECLREDSAP